MNPLQMSTQMIPQFMQFRQQFPQQFNGQTPQAVVQQMLNSGRMSQVQFEWCRNMANMLRSAFGV